MPKLKLVICDDAAFIRKRLVNLIEAHFPEVSVTGNYPDGDNALAHLKKEPIDILITDIRMENTDGLTVAKYIYEKKLHTKVIIITGYQDFEYAQKALKYRTLALITKPIDTKELLSAVDESIKALSASFTAATEESRHFVNQYKQTGQLLKLYFSGKISSCDLNSNEALSNTEAFSNTGYILNFHIPDNAACISSESWNDFVLVQSDAFSIYPLECCSSAAAYIVLFSDENPQHYREKINSIVSDTVKTVSLFNRAKCNSAIFELDTVKYLLNTESFKKYGEYLSVLGTAGTVACHSAAQALTDTLSDDEYKVVLSQLLVCTAEQFSEFNASLYYSRIGDIGSGESGEKVFSSLHRQIILYNSENDVFSELIIQYIHNNISDKDLSLEKVSKHFNYSPEHFSRKFKKALNITFQSYLTNLRIDEAKKLLINSSISIVAVSNGIGFKNPAYFSKVFKKYTGLLPKDWRNK